MMMTVSDRSEINENPLQSGFFVFRVHGKSMHEAFKLTIADANDGVRKWEFG
jgi:hypothetical protein